MPHCTECHAPYAEGGDGWNGKCPDCAGKAEVEELDRVGIFLDDNERDVIVARLRLAGITSAVVSFAGSGDSGQIDGVQALDAKGGEVSLDGMNVPYHEAVSAFDSVTKQWVRSITPETMPLRDVLEKICEHMLDKTGLDWHNNDGGQGELTIDLTDNPAVFNLEVGINVMSTEDYSFTL